jgi:2-amino-4-hydroxy-6-hydroxymethyldihydropteridine diphosphokinase
MSRACLALGSNLGDRQGHLDRAIARLRADPSIQVQAVSRYYQTAPVGGPAGQGAYLNAAAAIETTLSPENLLSLLLEIERREGRVRAEPNAPRTLDLDIVLYDHLIRASPDPVLPHPRMHERRFVLAPLSEIAGSWIHPVLNQSIAELLARLPADGELPQPFPLGAGGQELAGLRAVVTGSTSGIGKAIAREFARAGASFVAVHGRRSREAVQAIATEVRHHGVQSAELLYDLSASDAWPRVVDEAWGDAGVDIWVNNAGADLLTTDAARWTFERKWSELVAVDLTATMMLSRLVGARMAQGRGGVIINIGWDQAETGMAGENPQLFSACKAAVMAFSRSLALDLAPRVRVNCLAPGWIRTAWGESAPVEWQERVRTETPLGCWGLPEDVASAARWLASPTARFITGQTIRVNGGAIR